MKSLPKLLSASTEYLALERKIKQDFDDIIGETFDEFFGKLCLLYGFHSSETGKVKKAGTTIVKTYTIYITDPNTNSPWEVKKFQIVFGLRLATKKVKIRLTIKANADDGVFKSLKNRWGNTYKHFLFELKSNAELETIKPIIIELIST